MPKIKLDDLREGMIVESDVKNLDDMLLLPSGCELTDRHIRILQAWGITDINVKASDQAEDIYDPLQRLDPVVLQQLTEEHKSRFLNFDEKSPVQQFVLKLVLQRKAKAILSKQARKMNMNT